MKFSSTLSFALLLLPVLQVSAGPFQGNRGGKNGAKGGNANPSLSSSVTSPAASASPKVNVANNNGGNNGGGNNGGGNNGGGNNNQDPQQSLNLDPQVLCKGCGQDGQNPPVAGQVPSQTSVNNFINYCLTVPNLPITNGQQIQTGSCNPVPMGQIPSSDNMPSAKFKFPANGQQIPANQQFTVQMAINNLVTGNFVNAQANYFAAPQQLQGGVIMGHSHVTIEKLTALDQTTPTNPKQFAFFKGLNDAAQGGVLSTSVTNGLPAGAYRMCSINTSSNHQPCLVPIAQHGGLDDCSYFEAVDGGANNGGANNGGANNGGANNGGANNGGANNGGANNGGANNGGANGGASDANPSPSASTPATPSPSPAGGVKKNGGQNGGGNGGKRPKGGQ